MTVDHSVSPTSIDLESALLLVKKLVGELNKQEISYCHWKSNHNLDRALVGIDDLDLLVAKQDICRFVALLGRLDFKQANKNFGPIQYGVYHFYGYDAASGTLVHVHAYSNIVTGDSLIKSYALPVETMLLEKTDMKFGVKIPTKAAELVIFVLRNSLKHLYLLDIYFLHRDRGSLRSELNWLDASNNTNQALKFVQRYLPEVDVELFKKAMASIITEATLISKVSYAFKLHRVLQKYTRCSYWVTTSRTIVLITQMSIRKFLLNEKYLTFQAGGLLIALVGPKATGKSTLTNGLVDWLGQDFSVSHIHAGKPPSTIITLLPNLMLPLLRKMLPQHRSTVYEKIANEDGIKKHSMFYIVRKLILAFDRHRILLRAHRNKRNGKIVVSDRYPSCVAGSVDSLSFTDEEIANESSPIRRYLMDKERALYQRIPSPDIVFELHVPIEIAVDREMTREKDAVRDPEYVKFRHLMTNQPRFSLECLIEISTENSLQDTLRSIKEETWKRL